LLNLEGNQVQKISGISLAEFHGWKLSVISVFDESPEASYFEVMNKEEIYEKYWKRLVQIRRLYSGNLSHDDTMYLQYKKFAENERDILLKKYGFEPFSSADK